MSLAEIKPSIPYTAQYKNKEDYQFSEKSSDNTIAFLKIASSLKLRRLVPQHLLQSIEQYARTWNIIGIYYGTHLTREEIANFYRVSTQRINKIIKDGIKKLYRASPPEVQKAYPLRALDFRKPLPLESRKKISLSFGGLSARILEADCFQNSPQEVKTQLGINSDQLASSRHTLRGWGFNLPYELERNGREYRATLETLEDPFLSDVAVQRILNTISFSVLRSCRFVSSLREVARDAGFHLRNENILFFAESLRKARIPFGRTERKINKDGKVVSLKYYFFASIHRERVFEAFLEDQDLDRFRSNPVIVLGENSSRIPTTYELTLLKKYQTVSHLLSELPAQFYKRDGWRIDQIIGNDCPIPVYFYNEAYYYPIDQKDTFKKFLENRVRELEENS